MTNEITMNALVAKRAEILFAIGEAEQRIAQLQTALVHLDAVLRMFRRDFKAEGLPVRRRRPTKAAADSGLSLSPDKETILSGLSGHLLAAQPPELD
jgi:hypothetical protein